MLRLIFFIAFIIALDVYAYQAFRFLVKGRWGTILYFLITLFIIGGMIYQFSTGGRRNMSPLTQFFIVSFVILIVCKLVIIATMFGEDIFRLIKGGLNKLTGNTQGSAIPSRRKFVSQIALGLAAIPFASILYGVIKGRYNFKVLKYTLSFDDLPEAFDGYKITQISDVHSGSFDNAEKLDYAIDLINEQASDAILFTGDMVNNEAAEMEPWKDTFARLKARDGKFSVLGNHDYGDYIDWPTPEAKIANLDRLKEIQKEMEFKLLLNEHHYIEKDGQRLAIVGVENWGEGGFKKAGDLNKAISGLAQDDFKILMSHDPSHWEYEVKDHPEHFHLTLSGHTHGMQFGIEIPGWFKWSPVKWRYKYWAGIYEDAKQYINVNRGFGYLAFPGRVGIWPEITVIELKKSGKNA
ncbi:metallophosphoesterase [Dokdonia donghaensis]|uniref:Phosphoesterase n=1 Tax=Dokdonia donghaensis DSW-1 TaxID=1300343 RepID=A0A0A2GY51_9FLAO|nr:metallophosphoesterase [Dokdonia donghaensis]ANH59956.1 putative metallophosphoesterase [Dokdonia donghaensis DSW-1]KGO07271.1 phosphoesterase [Dokdonia donghaensis DSW-1]